MIHHVPFGWTLREWGISLVDEQKKLEEMEVARAVMLSHLEQMSRCGVELFMDNREVLPAEAVARAVRENSPYMADYVLDAAGAVSQVRFDRVTRL